MDASTVIDRDVVCQDGPRDDQGSVVGDAPARGTRVVIEDVAVLDIKYPGIGDAATGFIGPVRIDGHIHEKAVPFVEDSTTCKLVVKIRRVLGRSRDIIDFEATASGRLVAA